MTERRSAARKRVMYGAVAAMPNGVRRNCIVKNLSDLGARVEFSAPGDLAEDIALTVPQTGLSCQARVVWVRDNSAGLAFTSAPDTAYRPSGDGLEQKLSANHKRVTLLQRSVTDLAGEA